MKTNKPLTPKTPLKAKKALVTKSVLKAREKPRKQLATPITKLRKKADILFSKAIRLRDVDSNGVGACITCESRVHWKSAHAGHFMSRRFPATRWDDENVNLQCVSCNTFNAGEQYKYSLAVDLKYGDGTAAKLAAKSQLYFKVTRAYIEEVIADSREEIAFYKTQGKHKA